MLKQLRKDKGISIAFMVNKLHIDRDRFKRMETGEVTVPAEFIPILSEAYGVSTKTIIAWRVKEWEKKIKSKK